MALRGNKVVKLTNVCKDFDTWPRVAVETGTFMGGTTEALAQMFEDVYTVELSEKYHDETRQRIAGGNIRCLFGDTGDAVRFLSTAIREPVFWFLDAHSPYGWSEVIKRHLPTTNPMPLWQEIDHIMARPYVDVIVVDDVHCFGGPHGWEDVTIENLTKRCNAAKTRLFHDSFAMLRVP